MTKFWQYSGLYYDGNSGIWYSYDHQSQQYIPCTEQNDKKASVQQNEPSKTDASNNKKVVISAPAATVTSVEKAASLPDAVQAAAAAAIAAEKKEKEKAKEIKLASKSSILANKKKMNNVLTMWKQRSHEGQATRLALDDNPPSVSAEDRSFSVGQSTKNKLKPDMPNAKENTLSSSGVTATTVAAQPISNSSGGILRGVIRSSGRGIVKSDASYSGSSSGMTTSTGQVAGVVGPSSNSDTSTAFTPFRTDASALGSYNPSVASGSGKRRFSEMPSLASKEQPPTTYRDRAAERRSLYGSSLSVEDNLHDIGFGDSSKLP